MLNARGFFGSTALAAAAWLPAPAHAQAPAAPAPAPLPAVFTLRINPLGFVNKARAQAELTLGTLGLGAVGSYYYAGSFSGPKAEAYLRFYTGQRLAEGFYLQAKGGAGRYTCRPVFDRTTTTYDARGFLRDLVIENDYDAGTQTFVAGGGGGGLGYQARLGRSRRLVLDIYAGLQFVPLPARLNDHTDRQTDAAGNRTEVDYITFDLPIEWYGLGPGSILNGMVGIGYTFGGRGTGQVPDRWRYQPAPTPPAGPDAPLRKAARHQPCPWAVR